MKFKKLIQMTMLASALSLVGCQSTNDTNTAVVVKKVEMTPSQKTNPLATHGVVTSPNYLATQAGLEVLRNGSNAIDAAIATAATLAVVYR